MQNLIELIIKIVKSYSLGEKKVEKNCYNVSEAPTQWPLHRASEEGRLDIVKKLIAQKANVNERDGYGLTPLHWASQYGHFDVVKELIARKANVNERDGYGLTPLHRATDANGRVEVVKVLIEQGADIESKDWRWRTPLHWASQYGRVDIVKELIAREVDIESEDNSDKTPLHRASEYGHLDVVNMLIENGADVKAKDNNGIMPLLVASQKGGIEVVKALIESGAEINAKDWKGNTPLHWASKNGHLAVVKELIARGAEIDVKDWEGNTPLHIAKRSNHPEIVMELLEAGAMPVASHFSHQKEDGEAKKELLGDSMLSIEEKKIEEKKNFDPDNTQKLVEQEEIKEVVPDRHDEELSQENARQVVIETVSTEITENILQAGQQVEKEVPEEQNIKNQDSSSLSAFSSLSTLAPVSLLTEELVQAEDDVALTLQLTDTVRQHGLLAPLALNESTISSLSQYSVTQQLVVLEHNQRLLMQVYQQKIEKRLRANAFSDCLQAHAFYRHIYIAIEQIGLACKVVASTLIEVKPTTAGKAAKFAGATSTLLKLIPVAGEILSTLMNGTSTVGAIGDNMRQTNAIACLSYLGTLKEFQQVAEHVAFTLTTRYRSQLEQLLLPEEKIQAKTKEAQNSNMKALKLKGEQIVNTVLAKTLKKLEKSDVEAVANYAVAHILTALLEGDIKKNEPLAPQFLAASLRTLSSMATLKKIVKEALGLGTLMTRKEKIWTLDGFYHKPGIYTETGKYFALGDSEPEIYGYCLGTEEEAEEKNLTFIASFPIKIRDKKDEVTAVSSSLETQPETVAHTLTLVQQQKQIDTIHYILQSLHTLQQNSNALQSESPVSRNDIENVKKSLNVLQRQIQGISDRQELSSYSMIAQERIFIAGEQMMVQASQQTMASASVSYGSPVTILRALQQQEERVKTLEETVSINEEETVAMNEEVVKKQQQEILLLKRELAEKDQRLQTVEKDLVTLQEMLQSLSLYFRASARSRNNRIKFSLSNKVSANLNQKQTEKRVLNQFITH